MSYLNGGVRSDALQRLPNKPREQLEQEADARELVVSWVTGYGGPLRATLLRACDGEGGLELVYHHGAWRP